MHPLLHQSSHGRRQRRGRRVLSTTAIKEILSETAALGALSIRFTGGEPLLRKDFIDLYLHACRLGLKVLLFTNARLITPELADLFARTPPLLKIEVTVYGLKPESYEAVSRVPGSYEEFRRGIGLLRERNVPFVVKGPSCRRTWLRWSPSRPGAATLPAMDEPPGYSLFFDLRARRDSRDEKPADPEPSPKA